MPSALACAASPSRRSLSDPGRSRQYTRTRSLEVPDGGMEAVGGATVGFYEPAHRLLAPRNKEREVATPTATHIRGNDESSLPARGASRG